MNCDHDGWVRRRQMRLLQVRKQSDDIAKRLRQRVNDEQQKKRQEKENEIGRKIAKWKMERLNDLEHMYRNAINEFGAGHRMAVQEQCSELKSLEKQKLYDIKANERGLMAIQQALKDKQEAMDKKMEPVYRKKLVRELENLRSVLICSIPGKEKSNFQRKFDSEPNKNVEIDEPECKLVDNEEVVPENTEEKVKPFISDKQSYGKKKTKNETTKKCRDNIGSSATQRSPSPKCRPIKCHQTPGVMWVDLKKMEKAPLEKEIAEKEAQDLHDMDVQHTRMKNQPNEWRGMNTIDQAAPCTKSVKGKAVDSFTRSLRADLEAEDTPSTARTMETCAKQHPPSVAETEVRFVHDDKERERLANLAEERGNRAIQREKINRDYTNLLAKLSKLSNKEKLIKSHCHLPPPDSFMSDERRMEKAMRKQRIMNSEFERIYHDVMGANPNVDMRYNNVNLCYPVNLVTKLDFSQIDCNLKTNSPASTSDERETLNCPCEKVVIKNTPSSLYLKRIKFKGCSEDVVKQIDEILEKSRKIRDASEVSKNTDGTNVDGKNESLESGTLDSELCDSFISSPFKEDGGLDCICEKQPPQQGLRDGVLSQHDDKDLANGNGQKNREPDNTMNSISGWSSTTSYRDLPPVIRPGATNNGQAQTFANVEGVNSREPDNTMNSISGWSSTTSYRDLPPVIRPDATDDSQAQKFASVERVKNREPDNTMNSIGGWSSTTSYRDLPPVIRPDATPDTTDDLVQLLEDMKRVRGRTPIEEELLQKLQSVLRTIIQEAEQSFMTNNEEEFECNPQLHYYITKLLKMKREEIANLTCSSSSEASLGSPALSDNNLLTNKNEDKYTQLCRAKELVKIISRWKNVLDRYLRTCTESFDSLESSRPEPERNVKRIIENCFEHENRRIGNSKTTPKKEDSKTKGRAQNISKFNQRDNGKEAGIQPCHPVQHNVKRSACHKREDSSPDVSCITSGSERTPSPKSSSVRNKESPAHQCEQKRKNKYMSGTRNMSFSSGRESGSNLASPQQNMPSPTTINSGMSKCAPKTRKESKSSDFSRGVHWQPPQEEYYNLPYLFPRPLSGEPNSDAEAKRQRMKELHTMMWKMRQERRNAKEPSRDLPCDGSPSCKEGKCEKAEGLSSK